MKRRPIDIDLLRHKVGITFGREIKHHPDFEMLQFDIMEKTNRNISSSTLKRFFGYLKSSTKPSLYTLNTLATYAGCKNWHHFITGFKNKNDVASTAEDNKNSFEAIRSMMFVMELDLTGYIIHVNSNFLQFMNEKKKNLIGKHFREFENFKNKAEEDRFWYQVVEGKMKKLIHKPENVKDTNWLLKTYIPVKNRNDKIYKIVMVASILTKERMKNFVDKAEIIEDQVLSL